MGINIILPLIMGIAMTVIIGSQVAPSYIEKIKIAKVENRTISNQNLIKDAIVRYIKTNGVVPDPLKDPLNPLRDLEDAGLIQAHHKGNLFEGGYRFEIDKAKGILKIFTTINDEGASKYFSNSFKFPNAPTCIEFDQNGACTGKFETFYLLDEEIFNKIKPPVGSIEDIENRYSEENIGNKYDKDTLVGGEKDYAKNEDIGNENYGKYEEYEYNKTENTWGKTGVVADGIGGGGNGSNGQYGVWIKNIEVNGQMVEKVICDINPSSYKKIVLVINENKNLGELIWVAPNNVTTLKSKIFDEGFTPNNICTSNVNSMASLFSEKTNFNLPLNRWDTSKVLAMDFMFHNASSFTQDISNWNVSNVINMNSMFSGAESFNQDIGNWNVSNVRNMSYMFSNAMIFNQDISEWDVSNVTNMESMFGKAESFNQYIGNWNVSSVTNMDLMFYWNKFDQDIGNWNVSNVKTMKQMFYNSIYFNQDLSKWCVLDIKDEPHQFKDFTPAWSKAKPFWGTCP